MANAEQLAILKQGVEVWNKWRANNLNVGIDLMQADLRGANLSNAFLNEADFKWADLMEANLRGANLRKADFFGANLSEADLSEAYLARAYFRKANLTNANLNKADLGGARFNATNLLGAHLIESKLSYAEMINTLFGNSDLSQAIELENVSHQGPSSISTDTFTLSKGKIPEVFLRGCGLSDWEIEAVKLYNPDLSNERKNSILYKMYELLAGQALQISPLFISYSHANSEFVNKIGNSLTKKGIRFWRDVHDAKAGRLETQIDGAIRQNPTVLLILSKHSTMSDWVEHEVHMARELEKELGQDVLCPVALDDSWKSSRWPKRVMERIVEYNILDFSAWEDDSKFDRMFRKLIDGLELFYKG